MLLKFIWTLINFAMHPNGIISSKWRCHVTIWCMDGGTAAGWPDMCDDMSAGARLAFMHESHRNQIDLIQMIRIWRSESLMNTNANCLFELSAIYSLIFPFFLIFRFNLQCLTLIFMNHLFSYFFLAKLPETLSFRKIQNYIHHENNILLNNILIGCWIRCRLQWTEKNDQEVKYLFELNYNSITLHCGFH